MIVLDYSIKLEAKDGRYRYTITGFNYTHYNMATGKQENIWGKQCLSQGTLLELFKCSKCIEKVSEYSIYISEDIVSMIADLHDFVRDNHGNEDDW